MKFTVDRKTLARELAVAAKVAVRRPALPVLSGVRLVGFVGHLKPALVTSPDRPGRLHLLMPVRVS